jgi:hypothetical protein
VDLAHHLGMRKFALSLLIGSFALLGATACGPADAATIFASAEAEALAAMGVQPEDIVAAEPSLDPSPSPGAKTPADRTRGDGKRLDAWRKRHAAKVALHRNVLHGEAVVQTKEGTVTVLVQRGTVTAITGDSVTVKSSDGFTQTWKFHENLRVVEKRATIQPSLVLVGAEIALAGPKSGDTPMARLIVIPLTK